MANSYFYLIVVLALAATQVNAAGQWRQKIKAFLDENTQCTDLSTSAMSCMRQMNRPGGHAKALQTMQDYSQTCGAQNQPDGCTLNGWADLKTLSEGCHDCIWGLKNEQMNIECQDYAGFPDTLKNECYTLFKAAMNA